MTGFEQVADLVGALLMLAGAIFTLIASAGLFRFHDLLSRMHAASKPQLLGLFLLMAGVTLSLRTWAAFFASVLVIAIQMIAAPVASHIVGRTAYRTGVYDDEHLAVDQLAEAESWDS